MSYDETNRGAIWKNQRKEKEGHPDFTGSLNVNGVEFWVSAWKRKDDAGPKAPVLSFSVKPKEDTPSRRQSKFNQSAAQFDDMNDDVPF